MNKKISIKVTRKRLPNLNPLIEENTIHVKTVERIPFHRGFVGNFVPHCCRYNGNEYLIHGSIDSEYMYGFDNDAYIVID